MSDAWIGLCDTDARDEVSRALWSLDAAATLTFASSASELRERAQGCDKRIGVIVGPWHGDDVSGVNAAAAVARDGMAASVVLACRDMSSQTHAHAARAGIDRVVDLSSLPADPSDDLDEPRLPEDDLPTMVMGMETRPRLEPSSVPDVALVEPSAGERGDEGPTTSPRPKLVGALDPATGRRIPVLRETPGGMEVVMPQGRPPKTPDQLGPSPSNPSGTGTPPSGVARRVAARDKAPVITFVSGRGGVGKTSLVATMAHAAASWGMRVAVCDLDLSCGNLYSCYGVRRHADLARVAQASEITDEVLRSCSTKVSDRLTLWGPCELPEMAEAVLPKVEGLLEAISRHADVVLVDTATSITDATAQAAQACDRLVLVVDGRPGSMVAQARLGALAVRLGVARTRIARLANRCGPRGRGEPEINRAEIGLETARPLRVQEGGPEVGDCLGEGKVNELFELGSRFADSAANSLATLLEELGRLPDCPEARQALSEGRERSRWSFGRRREAV